VLRGINEMTSHLKTMACLMALLFPAQAAQAKDLELKVQWGDLPKSLVGQKLKVIQTNNKKVTGSLTSIEANGLVLAKRSGVITVPRADVQRIETPRHLVRTHGRIVWTAVGAGLGAVLVGVALTYANNEGGTNSDAIVGATVGAAAGATLVGYLAGRESDSDRTVILIAPEKTSPTDARSLHE
jgi:hypothetical protein